VTNTPESSEQYLGKHILRFEPPDAYRIALIGVVSGKEMADYNVEIARYAEGKRWLLAICDMTRTASFTPQARRETLHLPLNVRGVAVFGVSAKLRLPLTIVYKAFTLVRRNINTPLGFLENEAEARAWIDQRRREIERGDSD
jgi:hypothetical protein